MLGVACHLLIFHVSETPVEAPRRQHHQRGCQRDFLLHSVWEPVSMVNGDAPAPERAAAEAAAVEEPVGEPVEEER